MKTLRILAYIAAAILILFGVLFILGAFSPQSDNEWGWLLTGFILVDERGTAGGIGAPAERFLVLGVRRKGEEKQNGRSELLQLGGTSVFDSQ